MVEASAAGSTDRALILLRQADLFHEVLVVPEQPFMVHRAALPVTDGRHADCEAPARGLNEFAVAGGHGLRKRAGHHARYRGPGAGAEANRVHLDRDVRRKDEEGLEVLDVFVDTFGLVSVRPGHHDVFRVTFVQPVPFLVTKDVEVQGVEDLEVLLDRWRLLLVVGTLPDPEPEPGEVRIRVAASGINPGDVKKRQNAFGYGMPFPRVIPHSDGAGTIDRIGQGVARPRIGERVWCYGAQSHRAFGTAAEYVVVPSSQAVPF